MANEESEEGQFLGEIPEPLFKEHEGRFPQDKTPAFKSGHELPPDIGYQGRELQQIEQFGRIGTADFVGEVGTVWDARPINARDFLVTQKVSYGFTSPNGTSGSTRLGVATFTIPQGYTGYLREFSWEILDLFSSENTLPLNAYITVNDVPVPNYDNLRYLTGRFKNDRAPCYIPALAGQTIQIILEPDTSGNDFDTDIIFYMHGNLLLTRGLPLAYESTSQPTRGGNI